MADTPGGLQGAKLLTVRGTLGDHSVTFRVRWRAQSSGGLINEPRKELAADAVQRLFLDDSELVVPPTAAYCFPLSDYRRFAPDQKASFTGVDCVLGFVTYWLEGAKTVSSARKTGWLGAGNGAGLWDPKLFADDPIYAASVANCNVLMNVIHHGDAHNEQLLLERTPRGLRSYVVDNSIAFLSIKNPMLLLREDWSELQVPMLPQSTVARLKALAPSDWQRLVTVQELELRDGRLVPVALGSGPEAARQPNDTEEFSWHGRAKSESAVSGRRLRIGLTRGEIDLVASRVRALVGRPDLGKLTRAN